MKKAVFAAASACALCLGGAAFAERSDHDQHHETQSVQPAISQARALEIAAEQGVAHVHEVELRRGVWEVEGHTADDRAIEVEIDPQTGAIVKREVY